MPSRSWARRLVLRRFRAIAVALACAGSPWAGLPAVAAGPLPLKAPAAPLVPATWFTDLPAPEDADPAKEPCVTATGRLDVDGEFMGTASLVLSRREVLTVSHVPMKAGVRRDRFTFLLGYNRGRADFISGATVVARGGYYADRYSGSHYLAGDWALAVLDEEAPARLAPLGIYRGRREDLLGQPLWIQGYAASYNAHDAPFIARNCFVQGIHPLDGRLLNSCGADKGSSGAPLLLREQEGCSVVGIEAGGVEGLLRAPYALKVSNVATAASEFAAAASAVRRLLAQGLGAVEIRETLDKTVALDPP